MTSTSITQEHGQDSVERGRYPAVALNEAGIAVGVGAGVAMAAFEMAYAALQATGAATLLLAVAATFYGPDALAGGAVVAVWGAVLHLAVAAALAVGFAWIVGPYPRGGVALGWGIVYALAAMAVMTYVVLPWANPTMFERVKEMAVAWVVGHLIYGSCLALVPRYIRRS
jgi:hypothetical protein